MKMRLVKAVQPSIGLTLRKVYEGTVKNGFFCFNDNHGDERTRPDHEFEEVSSKNPQVGQWWVQTNKQERSDAKYFRAFFCGKSADGSLLFESVDGSIEKDAGGLDWTGWHHEPACTGWDWVPEGKEEFPQWYVSENLIQTAYIKRIDAETAVRVALDGREKTERPWSKHGSRAVESRIYTKVSQADAEARVTKKSVPTDVVNDLMGSIRKEPPAVDPKATAIITVYEVVYGDDLNREIYCQMFVGEDRLKSLQDNWKYVSVVSTKTVEVMLNNASCNGPQRE